MFRPGLRSRRVARRSQPIHCLLRSGSIARGELDRAPQAAPQPGADAEVGAVLAPRAAVPGTRVRSKVQVAQLACGGVRRDDERAAQPDRRRTSHRVARAPLVGAAGVGARAVLRLSAGAAAATTAKWHAWVAIAMAQGLAEQGEGGRVDARVHADAGGALVGAAPRPEVLRRRGGEEDGAPRAPCPQRLEGSCLPGAGPRPRAAISPGTAVGRVTAATGSGRLSSGRPDYHPTRPPYASRSPSL